PAEFHQFVRNRSFQAPYACSDVTCQQRQSTDNIRLSCHLICGSEQFPHGMTSESIVERAISELCIQGAALRRSDFPMMETNLFSKCSGFPALHSCGDNRDVIDAARFHRYVAANLLEALSPKKLASSGNM